MPHHHPAHHAPKPLDGADPDDDAADGGGGDGGAGSSTMDGAAAAHNGGGNPGSSGGIARGASVDRRGFAGKSLTLRTGNHQQWAARPRQNAVQPSLVPTSGGIKSPAVGAPTLNALLKRRPQLPSTLTNDSLGGGGGGAPEDVQQQPHGLRDGTPFADLLARRGGADGAIGPSSHPMPHPPLQPSHAGTAQEAAAAASAGVVDGGLVAGLEMLVSHVRRASGSGAAVADAGDANGAIGSVGGYEAALAAAEQRAAALRSRTSPLAGRRALPPSAQTAGGHHATTTRASMQSSSSAAAEEAALAAAAAGGHAASALSTSDVDDAIFSFAASLRANRRAYGNGTADGADDDGVLGWANGNSTLGLSATLPPSGAPLHSSFGGGPPPVQPLSAASRQRWSARDKERHGIGPFSTKDAHGVAPGPGMPPAAACGHGLGSAAANWPPRTWQSSSSLGSGGLNSRPRSVEGGGRPSALDGRGGRRPRRSTSSSRHPPTPASTRCCNPTRPPITGEESLRWTLLWRLREAILLHGSLDGTMSKRRRSVRGPRTPHEPATPRLPSTKDECVLCRREARTFSWACA